MSSYGIDITKPVENDLNQIGRYIANELLGYYIKGGTGSIYYSQNRIIND